MPHNHAKPSHDPIVRIQATGVLPVVVIDDPELAVPLAEALLAGGVDLIEITLRRPSAMAALARVARDCPDILPIAGTVVTPAQVVQVHDAGAKVAVSPGFSESVDAAMRDCDLPWLPGVATASDCMRAVAAGRSIAKFFPAEQAGGVATLKALSGPFPGLRFCPTGGVALSNLTAYLTLPTVVAVGGSWFVPPAALAAKDWATITRMAAEAREAVAAARSA